MDEGTPPKSSFGAKFITSALVIIFGWGALWSGYQGLTYGNGDYTEKNLADNNAPGRFTASVFDLFSDLISPKPSVVPTVIDPKNLAPIPDRTTSSKSSSFVTILIGGDVMLDRSVRKLGEKYGYDSLFASTTTHLFGKADITVVNLEGPITTNASKTLLKNEKTTKELTFTFSPFSAKALSNAGIDIVTLANNHTDNFGMDGLKQTKKYLTSSSIQWFGDPKNATSSTLFVTKNGMTVAFVGYNEFQHGFEGVLEQVSSASEKADFVIVMPHWGAEYASSSSAATRSKARQLVAAGADAIFGSHPHVIQEKQWMGDVPVFYSLGNLLFDQYFSPEVMKGNLVEMRLEKKKDVVSIDNLLIYETSTASRRGISVNPESVDFLP